MFPLLSLPNDLVLPIIEAIDDRSTLIALAQTCSKLQPLAEAELFRSIFIRGGAGFSNFPKILNARPSRLSYVHHLEVTPTSSDDNWQSVDAVLNVVRKLAKLKALKVENPCINGHSGSWDAATEMDRGWVSLVGLAAGAWSFGAGDAPLRNLTSFTFHPHGEYGSRYCDMQDVLPLFASHTLKHLHVSCIKILKFELPEALLLCKKTPLQRLRLDECNIDTTGLAHVLSLPRALTSLSLEETQYHGRYNSRSLLKLDPCAFLSALSQQSESLQYLKHTCPRLFGSHRPRDRVEILRTDEQLRRHSGVMHETAGLSSFKHLETLELDWLSILTQLLPYASLAPPNLMEYHLLGLAYEYKGHWEHIPDRMSAVVAATPMQKLELHTTPASVHYDELAQTFMSGSRAQALIKTARILKTKNITTKLVSYMRNPRWRPPILHNEEGPTPRLCFDSERFGDLEVMYENLAKQQKAIESKHGQQVIYEGLITDGTVLAARISTGYRKDTITHRVQNYLPTQG